MPRPRYMPRQEHDGYFEYKGTIVSKTPAEHQVVVWVADETRRFSSAPAGAGA